MGEVSEGEYRVRGGPIQRSAFKMFKENHFLAIELEAMIELLPYNFEHVV